MPVASSTSAPRSASSGRTLEPANRMPTRPSSSTASSTIRLFSASLSHVVCACIGRLLPSSSLCAAPGAAMIPVRTIGGLS